MKSINIIILFLFASATLFGQGMRNRGANIVIEAGAAMYIDGNANGKYVNESLSADHGEIDLNGNMYVEGDWENNATSGNVFVNNNAAPWGAVVFNGTTSQSIAGSKTTHFESIQINNSTTVLDIDSVEINFQTVLNSGHIDLNSKVLIINNSVAPDLIASAGYGIISESTSAPFGIIHWNIGSNTGVDYTFPFINATGDKEIPFIFIPTSGTTGYLRVATYHTPANNLPLPPTVNHIRGESTGVEISEKVVDRFWMIEVEDTTITADILFTATDSEMSAIVDARVQNWQKSEDGWKTPSGVQFNTDSRSVYASGVTNFNPWWGAAPLASPLPIELLSFTAECETERIYLRWVTATELNNEFFTLQKSEDLKMFETLAYINGSGNSNQLEYYSFSDTHPSDITMYYRLSQTDYDGTNEKFKPIKVTPCQSVKNWNLVSVTPQNGQLSFKMQSEIDDEIEVELFDMTGKSIVKHRFFLFKGNQSEQFKVKSLEKGTFILSCKSDDYVQSMKFMVQ